MPNYLSINRCFRHGLHALRGLKLMQRSSCQEMTESSCGLHGVGFYRAARPFGKNLKKHTCATVHRWGLPPPTAAVIRPLQSAHSWPADHQNSQTLSTRLGTQETHCALHQEGSYCSLNTFRSWVIYTVVQFSDVLLQGWLNTITKTLVVSSQGLPLRTLRSCLSGNSDVLATWGVF